MSCLPLKPGDFEGDFEGDFLGTAAGEDDLFLEEGARLLRSKAYSE